RRADQFAKPVLDYCAEWTRNPEPGTLIGALMPDGELALLDTRGGTRSAVRLRGWQQSVYEQCDAAQTVPTLLRHLGSTFPQEATEAELRIYLARLCATNLMVTDGRGYLATAIAKGELRMKLEQIEEQRLAPHRTHAIPAVTPSAPLVQLTAAG